MACESTGEVERREYLMLKILVRIIFALSATIVIWMSGLAFYNSKWGLGLRAALGQDSGGFLYAVSLYQEHKIADAIVAIHPVLRECPDRC